MLLMLVMVFVIGVFLGCIIMIMKLFWFFFGRNVCGRCMKSRVIMLMIRV